MSEEIWKKIPGHPNYSASSEGRIRNDRNGHILKPKRSPSRGGEYWKVDLGKSSNKAENKRKRNQYIHHLVALAFHGTRGEQVDHVNSDRTDMSAENLEPTSRLENMRRRHGKGEAYEPPGVEVPDFPLEAWG